MQNFSYLQNLPILSQFLEKIIESESTIDLTKYTATIEIKLPQTSITMSEILHFYQYCEQQDFIRMHSSRNWTDEEWKVLLWITLQYCQTENKSHEILSKQDWPTIAAVISFKEASNCHFKWLTHLKILPYNKNWTAEEDQLLFKLMTKEQNLKWYEIQYEMFVQSECTYFRKAKQFRERWNNYLNPSVNRGIWVEDDDISLMEHALLEGLRWSNIAKKLKNRTENQVKNRFKSLINKEKKIQQIKEGNQKQNDFIDGKHGIDDVTRKLIISILNRLMPLQKTTRQKQDYNQSQIPQQFQQQDFQNQQQQLLAQQQQQLQQFQSSPLMMQPPFCYPQPLQQMPNIPMGYFPQYLTQAYQQYPYQSYSLPNLPNIQNIQLPNPVPQLPFNPPFQQNLDQIMVPDKIKEEENSSSDKSIQLQEPRPYKNICMSQQVSARSSANGSTSSVNSLDQIKADFQNLQIESQPGSPGMIQEKHSRRKQRSSTGAIDLSNIANTGKIKTKRSRFFYQSNEG